MVSTCKLSDLDSINIKMDYDRDQRPPVRENFSDEACRDFIIYELGLEKCLPQLYRYKEGVEEVRKRLMIRFGDTNLGRSMKIFNSILEDDDATGLGDEGDIWRSWRHSFVHCHVSTLCPTILLQCAGRFSH